MIIKGRTKENVASREIGLVVVSMTRQYPESECGLAESLVCHDLMYLNAHIYPKLATPERDDRIPFLVDGRDISLTKRPAVRGLDRDDIGTLEAI